MARKAPTAILAASPPALAEPLRRLNSAEARWQREQVEEIEQLREAWAPQAAKARALIDAIETLKQQHAPLVNDLGTRRYEGIPAAGLNYLARIENLCREIQQLWHQPVLDLRRMVAEIEQLRPETAGLFRAHRETFEFYLKTYPHTPGGIADSIKALMHTVEQLAQQLEADDVEPSTPARRFPPAAPLTPEVEMA